MHCHPLGNTYADSATPTGAPHSLCLCYIATCWRKIMGYLSSPKYDGHIGNFREVAILYRLQLLLGEIGQIRVGTGLIFLAFR